MQKSIILELVDNWANYTDRSELFEIEEYWKGSNDFNIIIDELCKDLSDEERQKILGKIFEAMGSMERVAIERYFEKGFKLGLTLGVQNVLN